MIIHDAPQGTLSWLNARLGLPTASCFHKIITPKGLKLSEQRYGYKYKLLAEWLTGISMDETPTVVMDRGTELEPKARLWYELTHNVEVTEVGLCLTDDGKIGASPDGLVGDDGGLEIKVPMLPSFVSHLLGELKADEEHKLQVQGALYVTGRRWWDIVIYNPTFGGIVTRVEPDKEVQAALAYALPLFLSDLELAKKYLIEEKGLTPYVAKASA